MLKVVADVSATTCWASDVPGRLGGDEFALLLPNMKTDAVQTYVDKLRRNLLEAMHPEGWPVTFSIGVASCWCQPRTIRYPAQAGQ